MAATATTYLHIQESPSHAQPESDLGDQQHPSCNIQISCGSLSTELSLKVPFDEGDESELQWFLEDYPESPFSLIRARAATKALDWYSKNLASQLENAGIFQQLAVERGRHAEGRLPSTLEIRVEALVNDEDRGNICRIHSIHWEALEDLGVWSSPTFNFTAVQVVRVVRPVENQLKTKVPALAIPQQGAFRMLFVCARHSLDDSEDISMRLLMDPIFEIIEDAKSKHRVTHAEILRPGTWEAFVETLENHDRGYFAAVHFDCHGWVSDGTANLDFVHSSGEIHSVPAPEVAGLLMEAGVLMVNLNSCSSAKATDGLESNLAFCLARSGVPTVIAMSYNILDVATSLFEQEFYRSWLLEGVKDTNKKSLLDILGRTRPKYTGQLMVLNDSVYRAVRKARAALRDRDNRVGAGGWEVSLRDYIVPVVYISILDQPIDTGEPIHLSSASQVSPERAGRSASSERRTKWFWSTRSAVLPIALRLAKQLPKNKLDVNLVKPTEERKTVKFKKVDTMYSSLQPNGFRFKDIDPPVIGRDRTIAELEAAIVKPRRNVTFIEGGGGSGKSILVRNICDWWKSTGYIEDFFYFDCRKYAALEKAHEYLPCSAEAKPMMTSVLDFIFSALFPNEVSRTLLRSKPRTEQQTVKVKEKLRSGRYLLVFDNADFSMEEKNEMLTPIKPLTIGSSFICRDSAMASATAMASLQSFIRDIYAGQCLVLVASRLKKWFLDYLPDVNAFMYQIPKLTLSSALSIGERKLKDLQAPQEIYNYPGSAEDFASLVELLQYNPLAIEIVYGSMVRNQLSPNSTYLKICTDSLDTDALDATMAYAGAGRFVEDLKKMADLDWHDGVDESSLPFSMFWVVDHVGYLPTADGGRYWLFVIILLYERWNKSFDHLGLDLRENENRIKQLIDVPISTEEGYQEVMDLLGVSHKVLELCKHMEQLGLVEQEQEQDLDVIRGGTDEGQSELAQSKYRAHPLFSVIARGGSFGNSDEIHTKNLRQSRRNIFYRYTLVRYNFFFQKQFPGGLESIIEFTAGSSEALNIDRVATSQILQMASKEFHSLLATLSWLSQVPYELVDLWKSLPQVLTAIVNPLANLWFSRKDIVFPFSETLNQVYQGMIHMINANPSFGRSNFVGFAVRQALRLAGLASYRSGLPEPSVYLNQARGLIAGLRRQLGEKEKLHWRFEVMLLEADAFEAHYFFTSGERERAFTMFRKLLTLPPPPNAPHILLTMYLNPALCSWLSSLRVRKHAFPSQHVLLQMKQPLLEIIEQHEVCDAEELASFNDPVQAMLRMTLYDIIGTGSLFPLPPRNRHFDTRFLQFSGSIGGEAVANGMDTGVSTLDPTGATSDEAEVLLLKAFVSQSNVAGSSGLAAIHMRIAMYFMGCGQWREVLRHLKAYALLPIPHEDRQNPALRSQNALMACLCFSKLHCYERAREHAFKAIEEATQARDDGQALSTALGAFAGIEAGRVRRYSVIPKLLLLKLLDITYSTSPLGQTSGPPSPFQLHNRKGDELMQLANLAPQLHLAWALEEFPEKLRQEMIGRPFPGMKFFEEQLDGMVFTVDSDIKRKLAEARGGRSFWMDRSLEVALYTEAEQILFGKEMPIVNHFADSTWAQMLLLNRHKDPTKPFSTVTNLDLPALRQTVELSNQPLSFDAPPPPPPNQAQDSDSDDSDSDSSDSSMSAFEVVDGYRRMNMFGNRFMEHMIDKNLRKATIPEEAWQATQAMFEKMENDQGSTIK